VLRVSLHFFLWVALWALCLLGPHAERSIATAYGRRHDDYLLSYIVTYLLLTDLLCWYKCWWGVPLQYCCYTADCSLTRRHEVSERSIGLTSTPGLCSRRSWPSVRAPSFWLSCWRSGSSPAGYSVPAKGLHFRNNSKNNNNNNNKNDTLSPTSTTRQSHQVQQLTEQPKISWTGLCQFVQYSPVLFHAIETADIWQNMAIELIGK